KARRVLAELATSARGGTVAVMGPSLVVLVRRSAAHARLIAVDVVVVEHPLVRSRLTDMRDARTDSASFRAALHELTTMLVYEAARLFPVEEFPIMTPVGPTTGARVGNP